MVNRDAFKDGNLSRNFLLGNYTPVFACAQCYVMELLHRMSLYESFMWRWTAFYRNIDKMPNDAIRIPCND